MSTIVSSGKKVEEIDLVDLFPPAEGVITQYYGRIGSGKTYTGTKDVLNDLKKGRVVYTNWSIHYEGYDSREEILWSIISLFWPFKLRYYVFPKENLRHIEVDEHFLDTFEKLTDAIIYLDEGHVAFDSYEMAKMSLRKRKAVLHTRHFNRSINIISQRPTAVHVSMRANVNRFYKCENVLRWPFLLFRRTEYQDLTNESVDEEQPLSTRWYIGQKKVLEAYDTKYLRGNTPSSQPVFIEGWTLTWADRYQNTLAQLARIFRRLQPAKTPAPSLGVKLERTTLKNGERLNTVSVGLAKLREKFTKF